MQQHGGFLNFLDDDWLVKADTHTATQRAGIAFFPQILE
jgi:hypothetical protein